MSVRGSFSLGLALALATSGCSRKAGPSGIVPRAGNAPGAVTLRFTNPTGGDVFIATSYASPFSVEDAKGRVLPEGHFCQPACGASCECMTCGSPLPMVERIPAGALKELRWSGDFAEDGHCDKGCTCSEQRFVDDSVYMVTLEGTRDAKADKTAPGSEMPGMLDPASGKCVAKVKVELRATAQSVQVPFSCGK